MITRSWRCLSEGCFLPLNTMLLDFTRETHNQCPGGSNLVFFLLYFPCIFSNIFAKILALLSRTNQTLSITSQDFDVKCITDRLREGKWQVVQKGPCIIQLNSLLSYITQPCQMHSPIILISTKTTNWCRYLGSGPTASCYSGDDVENVSLGYMKKDCTSLWLGSHLGFWRAEILSSIVSQIQEKIKFSPNEKASYRNRLKDGIQSNERISVGAYTSFGIWSECRAVLLSGYAAHWI